MTAVVLGARGQVGRALTRRFPDARALDRTALDLTDPAAVAGHDWTGVDLLLNAAAYTQVDAAQDPANRHLVQAVNVEAVGALAGVARDRGATLVHFSSEYVFDGRARGPIPEDAPVRPLSVYGQSKADGDRLVTALDRHLLLRTTWVVGEGRNFVRTMADLADRGVSPAVVDDQVGRLTFAEDLAAAVAHLVERGEPGTYNCTCGGEPASWADVAEVVFAARGRDPRDVRRVSTAEYTAGRAGLAPRPPNSVLDLVRLEATGFRPRDWRTALDAYLASLPR
ncbi:dTDP-4-dehydrorhamnose reductase [Geodermatophilus saharensis]|uniref:dTDP-4-dehydrorhamnose reductase n=1 Tax=Geodermatophilus saharensis TaxID=1137994 RepID=A0A239IB05_9ACTN|nr:sugar nucleotide-binding protein [Geodermatophilus saharensis]SNS90737.1 dTDP-4-dehydrorhamnose reductase [Geodermatophilus saharensis]